MAKSKSTSKSKTEQAADKVREEAAAKKAEAEAEAKAAEKRDEAEAEAKRLAEEAAEVAPDVTEDEPKDEGPEIDGTEEDDELLGVRFERVDSDGQAASVYKPITNGKRVQVYSKWPVDLVFETPFGPTVFKGLASSKLIGASHMVTKSVPIEVWNYLAKVYGGANLFKNHFVFVAKDDASGEAHAAEVAGEKTGVEQLDPSDVSVGVRTYEGKE